MVFYWIRSVYDYRSHRELGLVYEFTEGEAALENYYSKWRPGFLWRHRTDAYRHWHFSAHGVDIFLKQMNIMTLYLLLSETDI